MDKYLTVAQFADRFAVSSSLVYRLIDEGVIPAVKIGEKIYRISPKAVHEIDQGGLFDAEIISAK